MPNIKPVPELPPDEAAAQVFYETFRKRLKEMREDAGLTQDALCDLIGVPLASYKHMEGKRASAFPLHKLEKLSRALRQSCHYILTGKEFRPPHKDHTRHVA